MFYISDPDGNKITKSCEYGSDAINLVVKPRTKGLLPSKKAYSETWERLKSDGYVLHKLPVKGASI